MSAEIHSSDGRYVCYDQDDGNFVVYDARTMTPLWDRFSHEATHPAIPIPPPAPIPGTEAPRPAQPLAGGGRLIRVTDERDGELINRGYSYWSQVYVRGTTAYVFAGHQDGHLRFYSVDLVSGAVRRLGNLLSGGE